MEKIIFLAGKSLLLYSLNASRHKLTAGRPFHKKSQLCEFTKIFQYVTQETSTFRGKKRYAFSFPFLCVR